MGELWLPGDETEAYTMRFGCVERRDPEMLARSKVALAEELRRSVGDKRKGEVEIMWWPSTDAAKVMEAAGYEGPDYNRIVDYCARYPRGWLVAAICETESPLPKEMRP